MTLFHTLQSRPGRFGFTETALTLIAVMAFLPVAAVVGGGLALMVQDRLVVPGLMPTFVVGGMATLTALVGGVGFSALPALGTPGLTVLRVLAGVPPLAFGVVMALVMLQAGVRMVPLWLLGLAMGAVLASRVGMMLYQAVQEDVPAAAQRVARALGAEDMEVVRRVTMPVVLPRLVRLLADTLTRAMLEASPLLPLLTVGRLEGEPLVLTMVLQAGAAGTVALAPAMAAFAVLLLWAILVQGGARLVLRSLEGSVHASR